MLWGGGGGGGGGGGRLGRKKKRVHGALNSHHPLSAFYYFDYCYFYRDTQWEPLRRREVIEH